MKITLYKNCIFSRSYSEVCDCRIKDTNGKTALDRYLATLAKEVFEIDSVYSTNAGTLNLPIQFPKSTDSLYDFNYLKIEYESLTRYCFIDNIQFMNYVAVVSYSEDVWHSYSCDMVLRVGWVANSTYTRFGSNYFNAYKIIAPQDGLGDIMYNPIFPITGYTIIAQAQKSTLVKGGNENELETAIVVISDASIIKWTWTKAQEIITELIKSQSRVTKYSSGNQTTCTFDNFLLIPDYMYDPTKIGTSGVFYEVVKESGIPPVVPYAKALRLKETDDILFIKTVEESDEKTIRSIGLFSVDFDYFVGMRKDLDTKGIRIGVFVSQNEYRIFLSYQGKIIDITDSLTYDPPVTAITGAEMQQAKIARLMKNINGVTEIAGSAVGYIAGGMNFASKSKLANSMIYASQYTVSGKRRKKYTVRDMLRGAQGQAEYSSAQEDLISSSAQNTFSVVNGITDLIEANASVFQSVTGTFQQNTNLLNCKYGVIFKLYDNIKTDIIENTDKNIGKEINDYAGDWFFSVKGDRYGETDPGANAVRFSWLNIYGKFPQDICEKLKSILIIGTKIWYDEKYI